MIRCYCEAGKNRTILSRFYFRYISWLSRIFFEQLRAGSILLTLGMQFVYVAGYHQQKHLGRKPSSAHAEGTAEIHSSAWPRQKMRNRGGCFLPSRSLVISGLLLQSLRLSVYFTINEDTFGISLAHPGKEPLIPIEIPSIVPHKLSCQHRSQSSVSLQFRRRPLTLAAMKKPSVTIEAYAAITRIEGRRYK